MDRLQNTKNKAVRVALYLRLSDEDRDKLTIDERSKSIKNQEFMLKEYAENEGWKIIGIYDDEDWSGADHSRPNFNKMIVECKNGNIDIVLCKTQARFARDSELIEKYIHNLFHEWNVRFLTLVDRIDNLKHETKKTSQILGLTDEWYLEDTSLNIRETLKSKRKAGNCTASFSKYGYIKDPENNSHLIPDPIASEIVKRIFDDYIKGNGLDKIASNLNKEKIPSPLEYKKMHGSKLQIPLLKEYLNYEYIEKVGTYIININLFNNNTQILKNLTSFNYLTTDKINFNNKCKIVLKDYTQNKTKVYYSKKSGLDINNFNIEDLILLNKGDTIPSTARCIITKTDKLDRTHIMNYQFEITLKENINKEKFYFIVEKVVDNIDVDLNFKINIRRKLKWSSQTIKSILKDEVYIGNMVQFKTTTVSYKNHTIIYNNDDKRIRKNDTHTGIVDKSTWLKVQQMLKRKSRSCKNGEVHAFSNKVFCMNCNSVFCKCGKKQKSGYSYLCCKNKKNKLNNCNNNKYLREEEFHEFILEKINFLINKFYDEKILNNTKDDMIEQDLFKEKIKILEKELNNTNKDLQTKNSYFKILYEDHISGILPEKEFLILMSKYKDDTTKLEERIKIIEKDIITIVKEKEKLKSDKNIFKKYKQIDKLNTEIVNHFIDKVLVGNYNEKTNSRNILIIWNFII